VPFRLQTRTPDGDYRFAATNLPVAAGSNIYTAVLTDVFGRSATSRVSVIAHARGYGYDANGNMTNDGQFAYEWDESDRLRSVRSVQTGQILMTCAYDGLGRRREKVEFTESGAVTTRYAYIERHAAGGVPYAVYVHGPGTNESVEVYTHGPDVSGILGGAGGIGGILSTWNMEPGTWNFFHYDGNVVLLTDSNGTLVCSLDYAPFGTALSHSGTYQPRYYFSSKEYDQASGLYYFGFRYYSLAIARWLSRDPLKDLRFGSLPDVPQGSLREFDALIESLRKFKSSVSKRLETRLLAGFRISSNRPLYVFMVNDPVRRFDPFGLFEYYGNYCGPDYCGGKHQSERECACSRDPKPSPTDAMDSCCKDHDMCLGGGGKGRDCDTAMCKCLSNVDCTDINPPSGKDVQYVCDKWRWMLGVFCGASPHP
jgi:RHS repeat-associated protein